MLCKEIHASNGLGPCTFLYKYLKHFRLIREAWHPCVSSDTLKGGLPQFVMEQCKRPS